MSVYNILLGKKISSNDKDILWYIPFYDQLAFAGFLKG